MPLPAPAPGHVPAPVARTYSVLQGIFPLAAPLAGAAVALYLIGQLLGLAAPLFGRFVATSGETPPAASASSTVAVAPASSVPPAPAAAAAATSNGRNITAADAGALEALVGGRHALLAGARGAWPRAGKIERFRLDEPPRVFAAPEGSAARALAFARTLFEREYAAVETLSVRLVTARHLGPEWPGTSVDAGVSAPSEEVLAERPAWLILARAQDGAIESPPNGSTPSDQTASAPPRTTVELLVIDAMSGALLLRPPAALVEDFEAAVARLAYHPAQDRTRPLGYFGDPAP